MLPSALLPSYPFFFFTFFFFFPGEAGFFLEKGLFLARAVVFVGWWSCSSWRVLEQQYQELSCCEPEQEQYIEPEQQQRFPPLASRLRLACSILWAMPTMIHI